MPMRRLAPGRFLKARTWLIAIGMVLSIGGLAFAAFFQSFETDTAGWTGATRVSSGTHGVPSKTGAFHAEDINGDDLTYTFWGGESKTFPPGGYTTSVDIYLDIAPPYMNGTGYANDTRFDWSSAIGTPDCNHRRDFVFNAGYYNDTDATGTGPRFVVSASNNATRSGAFPKNPGRMPYTINVEGWYTFEHRFYSVPPGPGGTLRVDLTIKNALGVPLFTWTLSDPSDIIGVTVGGNQYGWFVIDEFPSLAFDTSALVGFQDFCQPPASTANQKVTGGGWITVPNGKATFGLTAKSDAAGSPSGNLTYQDHAQNRTVKSTAITALIVSGNCARILGTATVNGAGSFGFDVTVCDNGEPGKDTDTFSITMSDGYAASGTLAGGNIQLH
ncbi:MAG TPA: post-COAP-1 domain-containing protein [Pyrinomonadaceae bacterium]